MVAVLEILVDDFQLAFELNLLAHASLRLSPGCGAVRGIHGVITTLSGCGT